MTLKRSFDNNKFNPCPKPLPREKPRRKRIPRISKKRAEEQEQYKKLREEFLKGKYCPITGRKATEVHHKKGRVGKNYLDTSTWLAVSRDGHQQIELNPDWAKRMGYSDKRL